jgi:hypothetical protein
MSDAPADTATPDAPEASETTDAATADVTAPDPTALAADVEKWQKLARKHEDRAKANADAAKELERIKREALPEQERLVAEAIAAARAEVLNEVGSVRVDDAVKLAAAGRPVDVEALLEGLDRSRFLVDGQPDAAAITAWVDRIAPAPDPDAPTGVMDLGQGARQNAAMALNGDPLLDTLKSKLGIG